MNFKEEIQHVKRSFLVWLVLFFIVIVLFCTVGITFVDIQGYTVPFPSTSHSLVTQFFAKAKHDLLPLGAQLISTSPITVFLVQMKIAVLGSFMLLSPYLLYSIIGYLSPALFPRERRRLFFLIISSTVLFFLGMLFAYHFLVRLMFGIFLSFNLDMAVTPYLAVDEFMDWTLAAIFLTGLLFLLPIFMYMLTVLRIAKSSFWASKWREAFLVFLVVSSIITPDVSGVSVLFLSVPMTVLYIIGIIAASFHERRLKNQTKTYRV